MSCRCSPSGLSGMGDYRMNGVQISSFLIRHPLVAENVAQTKLVILSGLYDWDYNPALQWRVPGTIPPWGLQVYDSVYKTVTIFPARDGTMYYTAETGVDLGADKPDYVSPPVACRNGEMPVLGVCSEDLAIPWALIAVGVGVALYLSRR